MTNKKNTLNKEQEKRLRAYMGSSNWYGSGESFDELKQHLANELDKQKKEIIEIILNTKYDNLGMGKMSKDEKMGVDAFKMYLKHRLRPSN